MTIYGRKTFLEVFRNQPDRIQRVVCADGIKLDPEVQLAFELLRKKGVKFEVTNLAQLDKLSSEGNHQGIIFELTQKDEIEIHELLQIASRSGNKAIILALDQITDPQNLGALLRVAEAAGVCGVVATKRRSAPLSPTARKASAGASELLPICMVDNLQYALRDVKAEGYWIIGTAIGNKSQPLFTTEFPHPCCIVVGSEGKGLRQSTVAQCDLLVEIPIQGKVQSLNVSQAAAIVLFELVRRNLGG